MRIESEKAQALFADCFQQPVVVCELPEHLADYTYAQPRLGDRPLPGTAPAQRIAARIRFVVRLVIQNGRLDLYPRDIAAASHSKRTTGSGTIRPTDKV